MIVVLTLGRSGSSLLLQTLRCLGLRIEGRMFDSMDDESQQKRHQMSNPKGYFEDPSIYYSGPSSNRFTNLLNQGDRLYACKMDIGHFVDPAQQDFWLAATPRLTSILVSFREPSEQGHSEALASLREGHQDKADRFVFLTQFLSDYCHSYGAVYDLLGANLVDLKDKVHFIDYASIADPHRYVFQVLGAVGANSRPEQIRSAEENISPDLYRVRRTDLPADEVAWARTLGADKVYSQLKDMTKS